MIWGIIFLIILGCIIGFDVLLWLILGLIVIAVIYNLATANDRKREKEEWEKKRQEEIKRKRDEQEKKEQQYKVEKNEILAKYGQPDKVISIKEYDLKQEIIVFAKINRIWLLGEDIPFGDILDCSYNDNYSIKKGKVEYQSKTKTNNGNMVGRAVVGGVLAGGAGAIIGGATASKDTQTVAIQGDDTVIHNYTVVINVNSFSNPVVRIPLGQDGKKVNEIVGLMNVIISKNKQ